MAKYKEMAARREIRNLGLHQHVSYICARDRLQINPCDRLLLCCGVLLFIAVSEHEADDKLDAVAIQRKKPRPQPPGPTTPRRSTVFCRRYTEGLMGEPESPPVIFANPK